MRNCRQRHTTSQRAGLGSWKLLLRGGEISLNDSSIRDLTCALIISWAPLQIKPSNRRQIWQALLCPPPRPPPHFTSSTPPPLTSLITYPDFTLIKETLSVSDTSMCLPTVKMTRREKLTVKMNHGTRICTVRTLKSTDKKHDSCVWIWHRLPSSSLCGWTAT